MASDTKLRLILEAIWKGRGVQQAERDLNRLNKTSIGTGGGLKMAGIAAGVAGGLVSVLTSKVLQAAGAMKGLAIESALLNARYETMGVVVDNLGRNVDMTSGEMRALEKDLEATGISMLGAREAIAKLVGAEIDLANATDLARVAQDAAVIAGENSTAAFQRLINFITTGNTRVARQAGLFINLNQAYQEYADSVGKSVNDLTELEKVQIRTNATIKAGALIAGTYEEAMTTAGKQLGSMERDVENLKVAVGALANEFLEDAVPATRTFLQELTVLAEAADKLQEQGVGVQEEDLWFLNAIPFIAVSNIIKELGSTGFSALVEAGEEYVAQSPVVVSAIDDEKLALMGLRDASAQAGEELGNIAPEAEGGIDALRNYTREAMAATAVNQLLKESMADGFISDTEMDRVAALSDRFGVDLPANLGATVASFNQLQAVGIDPAAASADTLFSHLLGVEGVTGNLTARDHRIVYNIDIQGDLDMLQMAAGLAGQNFDFDFTPSGDGVQSGQTAQERFEAGGGRASGGRISSAKGIFEVGEAGPEFVIDGVVMPAHVTRQMKRLGLRAGRGFAGGGFAFDVDTIAQITGSSQTAASMSFSQQQALTQRTVEAARSGGGSTTTVGPSRAQVSSPAAAASAAATAVEQSVAPSIASVNNQMQAQLSQQMAATARAFSQANELLEVNKEMLAALRAQGTSTDFANDVGDAINEVLG